MKTLFATPPALPAYHENLLLVKMRGDSAFGMHAAQMMDAPRPAGGRAAARAARDRPAGATVRAVDEPGLHLLALLEKAGRIKRAIQLSRRAVAAPAMRGPGRAMATLAAAAAPVAGRRRSSDPLAGATMLELERSSDIDDLRTSLAADPSVEFVARVPRRYLHARGRTTRRPTATPPSTMWNLGKIEWPAAREARGFRDADGIRVAVLDTGIEERHPDLAGRIGGYVHAHPETHGVSDARDHVGHGTHVAGTIGAVIGNAIGINGVCACDLRAWKIFNDQPEFLGWSMGFGYVVDPVMYQRALADCLEDGIRVVNLSIGGPGEPDLQERLLFDELLAAGVTVVAAMGNEREFGSPISYPAAIPGVIAVGATNINDRVATFSNRGPHISLCAPGVGIWSTLPTYAGQTGFRAEADALGNPIPGTAESREVDYAAWDGTSMAAPHVAAAAALLLAKEDSLPPDEVKAKLEATADAVGEGRRRGPRADYGAGRLNLRKLLA